MFFIEIAGPFGRCIFMVRSKSNGFETKKQAQEHIDIYPEVFSKLEPTVIFVDNGK